VIGQYVSGSRLLDDDVIGSTRLFVWDGRVEDPDKSGFPTKASLQKGWRSLSLWAGIYPGNTADVDGSIGSWASRGWTATTLLRVRSTLIPPRRDLPPYTSLSLACRRHAQDLPQWALIQGEWGLPGPFSLRHRSRRQGAPLLTRCESAHAF
jgi:hypothetical protein